MVLAGETGSINSNPSLDTTPCAVWQGLLVTAEEKNRKKEKGSPEIRFSITELFGSVLSQTETKKFSSTVLDHIFKIQRLKIKSEHGFKITSRGTHLNTLPSKNRERQKKRNNTGITKMIEVVNNAIPELFSALQLSPTVFRHNADIDIEVESPEELNSVVSLVEKNPYLKKRVARPYLTQFTIPGMSGIFINVINLYELARRGNEISLFDHLVRDFDFYEGRQDRRFAVSKKMDVKAELKKDDTGKTTASLSSENAEILINHTEPDMALVDEYIPVGQQLSTLARQNRYWGCALSSEQAQLTIKHEHNITEPLSAINARLSYEGQIDKMGYENIRPVTDNFDRITFISSNLVLMLLNPEFFALALKTRSYAFAASRYFQVRDLNPNEVSALSTAIRNKNIDDIVQVLDQLGLVAKNPGFSSLNKLASDIVKKTGLSKKELNLKLKKAFEVSGISFTINDIESLIKILILFDQWNPVTEEPNTINGEMLLLKKSGTFLYRDY
ncbi:hypothetical protein A2767_00560 [Candidatus Roizmanbacteria bacterium RIFCSPHIGHO2_01_FULL_35_10]|uniref:Uncharacterized protein n=1 Tax=Candidatus Roizmanbacteria bacterium RIFCSPLOWO2_01_FULL_35_13 TaxID=1802055 RepID=A0A1F7IHI3_9BACT|nr:MAG: hypothetical protein A2767_00560 [Candidatus Roizmanbacteria bacterium RIFCSPHIGHO2_01_FULL_35_10]OGK42830.1 MAG: hypothetical protein A3A74_01325 [Candidatus Roizmanbacteria bacterium RIFCSPLOWO2_01_FULL_35_13]